MCVYIYIYIYIYKYIYEHFLICCLVWSGPFPQGPLGPNWALNGPSLWNLNGLPCGPSMGHPFRLSMSPSLGPSMGPPWALNGPASTRTEKSTPLSISCRGYK